MGNQALIGRTIKNGKIEVFYNHGGALNASQTGDKRPEEPELDQREGIVKDKKAFAKEVDYVFYEAVWLDGVCYLPVWVYPFEYVKSKSYTKYGNGILVRCSTGNQLHESVIVRHVVKDLVDNLTDLSIESKKKLIINAIVSATDKDRIADFSPVGYNHKPIDTKELFERLQEKEKVRPHRTNKRRAVR